MPDEIKLEQKITFAERLEGYRKQKNQLPNLTSLIWIGNKVPSSYLDNVFKHKKFKPKEIVQLFVSKTKLEKSNSWESLKKKCEENDIVLQDIETNCKEYINFDIVMELMKKEEDYVRASDILRVSLMYHIGGKYFDTDVEPLKPDDKHFSEIVQEPSGGFYLYHPQTLSGFSSINIDPSYLAGVKNHFFYFFSAILLRYFHKKTVELSPYPDWIESKDRVIRKTFVTSISGDYAYSLLRRTTLYPIFKDAFSDEQDVISDIISPLSRDNEKVYNIKHDNTWLAGFVDASDPLAITATAEDIYMAEKCDEISRFYTSLSEKITEDFLFEYTDKEGLKKFTSYLDSTIAKKNQMEKIAVKKSTTSSISYDDHTSFFKPPILDQVEQSLQLIQTNKGSSKKKMVDEKVSSKASEVSEVASTSKSSCLIL